MTTNCDHEEAISANSQVRQTVMPVTKMDPPSASLRGVSTDDMEDNKDNGREAQHPSEASPIQEAAGMAQNLDQSATEIGEKHPPSADPDPDSDPAASSKVAQPSASWKSRLEFPRLPLFQAHQGNFLNSREYSRRTKHVATAIVAACAAAGQQHLST